MGKPRTAKSERVPYPKSLVFQLFIFAVIFPQFEKQRIEVWKTFLDDITLTFYRIPVRTIVIPRDIFCLLCDDRALIRRRLFIVEGQVAFHQFIRLWQIGVFQRKCDSVTRGRESSLPVNIFQGMFSKTRPHEGQILNRSKSYSRLKMLDYRHLEQDLILFEIKKMQNSKLAECRTFFRSCLSETWKKPSIASGRRTIIIKA